MTNLTLDDDVADALASEAEATRRFHGSTASPTKSFVPGSAPTSQGRQNASSWLGPSTSGFQPGVDPEEAEGATSTKKTMSSITRRRQSTV